MRKIIFIPFLLMILCGCSPQLTFEGSSFYTIKGRIVDTTNAGIPNLQLSVLNWGDSNYCLFCPDGGGVGAHVGEAISATFTTDINGNFIATFPSSNGYTFLQFPMGYDVLNVPYNISHSKEIVQFYTDSSNNFLVIMPTIQIKPQ
jgi:hypothetical protein